ncbi:hypothetical protein GUA87_13435 [Sneathiella sp. P13V-1]|uniref:A24 family peptidase n=1 Tax=Sneathiella sp. P13V-1 TaxID=2697366 RepID=UPI00187B4485|nr:prepilin peptidase [Sneathiella sp. P13V-1]MBE7637853.1 hypothetical protein [Sneathiella sp. P13V-1]
MIWEKYLYLAVVLAAFLLTMLAAYSDWKSYKIPNYISLALIALFPVVFWLSPVEISWIDSLIVAGVTFVVGFILFAIGGFGGGDVKLIVALSLWAGSQFIVPFMVAMVLAGGGLVIVVLIREVIRGDKELSVRARVKASLRAKTPVPYGVAIALGSLVIFYRYAEFSESFS